MTDIKYSYYRRIFPILGKLNLIKPRHIKVVVEEFDGYNRFDIIITYSGGFGTFKNEK